MPLQPDNIADSFAYNEVCMKKFDMSKPQWYRECHCLTTIYDAYFQNDVSMELKWDL